MSDMDINQVLSQMRAMTAAAQNNSVENGVANTGKLDFGEVMKNSLQQVSDAQAEGKTLATAFESGDTNAELPEVMIALQKASISFQAITQVRNKLLSAYQEVMNMQV
ncbi:MAG: flagellar hook-basal body complex protein FliE [Halioglobus sp.]|jgi:flagellar hook-basal body complex protein FliE